jgi:hypothetical protein
MDLNMSISDMLKYREILAQKVEAARNSGNQKMLSAILKRIDAIDILIDAAFMHTAKEAMPQIATLIDVNMLDREALTFVLGPNKSGLIPQHGMLRLKFDDETEEVSHEPTTLKEEMAEILRKNFVGRIPDAVKRYRELTGCNQPDSIVWMKIKDILSDKPLIAGWDRSITAKLINNGPVVAFYSIKKHLTDWSDMDIAIVMNDAAKRTSKSIPEEKKSKEMDTRTFGILDKFPQGIRDYLADEQTIDAIKTYAGLKEKSQIGRHMAELAKIVAPSTRAKILTRKEYIEKGY